MLKKSNKKANQFMLLMLAYNAVAPSASIIYAETTKPMIQLSLNSLAPEIQAGESAIYQMDFKVSGAMEEVNEQLNSAEKREVVIQLPEDTTFYEMPSDFENVAITSFDKDGNLVKTVPTYDADSHQLMYKFSSLRAGTSSKVFLKINTKNGITPNNTQMALSAKFAAGQFETSTNANVTINSQTDIIASKAFSGVRDKTDALAAKPGEDIIWTIKVAVPKKQVGQRNIKGNVTVRDVLPQYLEYKGLVNQEQSDITVKESKSNNTTTLDFTIPVNEEHINDNNLFYKEIQFYTKVPEWLRQNTDYENTVTASVENEDNLSVDVTSNKATVPVVINGNPVKPTYGNYLYPAVRGPKDGTGDYASEQYTNPNPHVDDMAKLAMDVQYHIVPGRQWVIGQSYARGNNDEVLEITPSNKKYNVDDILTNGYKKLELIQIVDPKFNFEYAFIRNPFERYHINIDEAALKTKVKVTFVATLDDNSTREKILSDIPFWREYAPDEKYWLLEAGELGLTEDNHIKKYKLVVEPINSNEFVDGRIALDIQPKYTIVPGVTGIGQVETEYHLVLHDGTKVIRKANPDLGTNSLIGPRQATIVQKAVYAPIVNVQTQFTEIDGNRVKVGDNKVKLMIKNMKASTGKIPKNIKGMITLPKGVTVKDNATGIFNLINHFGSTTTPQKDGHYTISFNDNGQQVIEVIWNKKSLNPQKDLVFEIPVAISNSAAVNLQLQARMESGTEQYGTGSNITNEKDYVLVSKKDLQTIKLVKGELDKGYSHLAKTSLGGDINYQITLTNTTGNDISKLGFIDILPSVDDKTVLDNVARGSHFTPTLQGAITVPEKWADKVEIFYSTETNPSRETVLTKVDYPAGVEEITNPASATDPAWKTETEVTDWSNIHSFKIELKPGTVMIPGQDITLEFKMKAPGELSEELLDVNTEGKDRAAWNSFAITTNGLLPTEPQRVGVYVEASGSVTAEYYIEGTDTKLPGENGEEIKVVKPEGTPTGEAYSDQAPAKLTDADGKTYVLVEAEGKPTLKDGSAATTGTVTKEEQVIKYQYKEVKGDVVVHYVDEEGNTISVDVTDTPETSTGTDYDTTDNKPKTITTEDGKTYELVPEKTEGTEQGKVVEGTTEVTYVYKEVVGSVTAEYYIEGTDIKLPEESGEESKVVKPEGTPTGEAYSDQAPAKLTDADGKTYVLVEAEGKPTLKDGSAATTGTVTKEEQVIKYQYKEVLGDVVVHYVNEKGEVIKDPVIDEKESSTGTDYDTTDNKPETITKDGKTYELVPEKTEGTEQGKVVEGTTEVTYVYKEVVGSVTAEYYIEGTDTKLPGENGEESKVVKPEGTPTGEAYSDKAPAKLTTADGKTYVLVEAEGKPTLKDGSAATTGTVAKEKQVIKYQYKEVKGDVVVHYVDEEGNTISVDITDTPEISTGTDYDTTDNKPKTITTEDGKTYELVPEKNPENETGKVVEGTTEVTYVYKEVVGSVTAEYYIEGTDTKLPGENGEEIKVVKPEGTPTGEAYSDKAPAKLTDADGKTYVLVEAEGKPTLKDGSAATTGTVAKEKQVIKYQYKEVLGDVVVHYVDEEGNTISVDVTDIPETSTGTDYDTTDNKPKTITTEDGKTYELVPEKTEGTEQGKVVEGTTEVTYVYKEVVGSVTAEYYIEGTDTKLPGENGEESKVVKPEGTPTGEAYSDKAPAKLTDADGKTYVLVEAEGKPTLKDGSAATTGTVAKEKQVIKYQYKEVKGDVVVHYVNEKGEVIKDPVIDEKESSTGTDYDTTDNKPKTITTEDGKTYELVPEKTEGTEQGKVVEGTTEVTYVYKEVVGSVTAEYYIEGTDTKLPGENGEESKVVKPEGTPTGEAYSDKAPAKLTDADGKTYVLVEAEGKPTLKDGSAATTGTVAKEKQVIKYQYKEVKGDVVVHYVDEEGNTISVDITDTPEISTGTDYDTTDNKPKTITTEDGKTYELVPEKNPENETGKVVEGTTEVTYVYKEVVGSVTAEYYIEGTDTKLPGENGEESKVVKPEGTPTGEAYSDKAPAKLTDADGKTYVLVEAEGKPTLKDGSAATTGTVAKEKQVIKYQYKEIKGDVVVHYVNEKGEVIKDPVIDEKESSTGTDYDTTDNKPTTITKDGKTYELVPEKNPENETGKVVEGTTEVTYVYKEVKIVEKSLLPKTGTFEVTLLSEIASLFMGLGIVTIFRRNKK